jgi:hypothetical protein
MKCIDEEWIVFALFIFFLKIHREKPPECVSLNTEVIVFLFSGFSCHLFRRSLPNHSEKRRGGGWMIVVVRKWTKRSALFLLFPTFSDYTHLLHSINTTDFDLLNQFRSFLIEFERCWWIKNLVRAAQLLVDPERELIVLDVNAVGSSVPPLDDVNLTKLNSLYSNMPLPNSTSAGCSANGATNNGNCKIR